MSRPGVRLDVETVDPGQPGSPSGYIETPPPDQGFLEANGMTGHEAPLMIGTGSLVLGFPEEHHSIGKFQ